MRIADQPATQRAAVTAVAPCTQQSRQRNDQQQCTASDQETNARFAGRAFMHGNAQLCQGPALDGLQQQGAGSKGGDQRYQRLRCQARARQQDLTDHLQRNENCDEEEQQTDAAHAPGYTRSTESATASPPPRHNVARPLSLSRACNALIKVTSTRA